MKYGSIGQKEGASFMIGKHLCVCTTVHGSGHASICVVLISSLVPTLSIPDFVLSFLQSYVTKSGMKPKARSYTMQHNGYELTASQS